VGICILCHDDARAVCAQPKHGDSNAAIDTTTIAFTLERSCMDP